MIKAKRLQKGDKIAIVSLSAGILGEKFCEHYIELGQSRLKEFGLVPVFMPNALKGIEYLDKHPEKRAEDLKTAFLDDEIKAIMCAIGGIDTYRTIEFLLDDEQFVSAVQNNPKLFTGFSDSTVNHLMFYKLGLTTYYGPNYINDFSEMADDLLPYTKKAFTNYYLGEDIYAPITASEKWYEERTDFSPASLGTNRTTHDEQNGFELIKGSYGFKGRLLGGCLESLYELLTGERDPKQKICNQKYGIFPPQSEWQDKILFIETCEEKPEPTVYRKYINSLKEAGVFAQITGLVHGKPQDEKYYDDYKKVLLEELADYDISILFNVNFGHAYPRTVLAYGVEVIVEESGIRYLEDCIS